MGFQQAVQSVLSNYVTFTGRAMRSEYWYWVLFTILVSIGANILDAVLNVGIISAIVGLAFLLPGLAVGVRRLHDVGKSGWNLLWALIPLLGAIYLLYLAVQPSQPAANVYGPAPA